MILVLATVFGLRAGALDSAAAAIESARALALKRDRAAATATLRRTLDQPASRAARPRVREALSQLSRIFFTDKGQRAFETGRANVFESPDVALDNLRSSLALEDGNVTVRASLATLLLAREDCAGAREQLAAARAMDPFDAETAVLELRAFVCEKDHRSLREKIRTLPALDEWQESFVVYLQALDAIEQGLPARAIEQLQRVVADHPRFPEARYHLARAEASRGGGEDALRKYVGLCKALTGRERREFALEPRACAHQKEAEDELAKKSVDL